MFGEEREKKLHAAQSFFVKSFFISFVLLFFATFMCIFMHDFQLAFVQKYFSMDVEDFNYMVVLLLGLWKILIIQFTLIPALAVYCMRKCKFCECNKD